MIPLILGNGNGNKDMMPHRIFLFWIIEKLGN
jgi:hypothetical protein